MKTNIYLMLCIALFLTGCFDASEAKPALGSEQTSEQKPEELKPEEPKPEKSKPEEPKPEEPKPEEPKLTRNILEIPLEMLYPKSAAKLGFGWIPERRERLYQKFKIEKQKEAQDLVDGVNKIYKESKINVKYVVHSVRFLDEDEASLYGVDDKGECELGISMWEITEKRNLPASIQDQKELIQGQKNPKAIAATVLFCKQKTTFLQSYLIGVTRKNRWTSNSMEHAAITIQKDGSPETLAHELGHCWGLRHVDDPKNQIDYTGMRESNLLMASYDRLFSKNTLVPAESAHINKRIKDYKELSGDFNDVLNFLPGDNTKELPVDDNIDDNNR
jgi:hypothetical protein